MTAAERVPDGDSSGTSPAPSPCDRCGSIGPHCYLPIGYSIPRSECVHGNPPKRHTATLEIAHGMADLRSSCPFDPADTSRPCWPEDEYGVRFDEAQGTALGCVYADWVGEHGIDAVTNKVEVTFALTAIWRGDSFDFELGERVDG